ncbi:hypothetical protein VN97_g8133 [Penicillium thymicola]|uniref:Uncharacterized protein n=1 Tax=Penicillium thymicola TaxID=293382 RepID=A0AAI9X5Y5_PENTH|nr:hypothetical protein VN97_g8133 [Penicillium thymicola]
MIVNRDRPWHWVLGRSSRSKMGSLAVVLEKDVSELRAANEKQKQTRTRSRRQVPAEEGLCVQEAFQLITKRIKNQPWTIYGVHIYG